MNSPLIYVLISAGFLMVATLIGALGYFIRSRFDLIDSQLSVNNGRHEDCYSSLTTRFADKDSTRENISKLWERADEHTGAIKRLEGKLNGGGSCR